MDPDLALVMGVIIGIFSVPSILSAFSDSRAPRASALTILIAFALIGDPLSLPQAVRAGRRALHALTALRRISGRAPTGTCLIRRHCL